jgi:hypothetical protein
MGSPLRISDMTPAGELPQILASPSYAGHSAVAWGELLPPRQAAWGGNSIFPAQGPASHHGCRAVNNLGRVTPPPADLRQG